MKRPDLPHDPQRPASNAGVGRSTGDASAAKQPAAVKPARAPKAAKAPKPERPVKSAKTARTPDPARAARREIRRSSKRRRAEMRAERRRFTAMSRRRRLMVLSSAGAIVVLFVAVFGVAYSPLMAVRTISVVGTTSLDPAQLQAALAGQIGTPLPLVSTDEIARSLAVFPAVQSFSTESVPPSTLVVRIVERTPIGSLKRNGQFDLVDSVGVVLSSTPEPVGGSPVLQVSGVDSPAFTTVSSMLLALTPDLRTRATEAGATSNVDAWFQLADGPKVIWGDNSNQALKLRVLQALLATSGGSGEINVSAPNSPFTR